MVRARVFHAHMDVGLAVWQMKTPPLQSAKPLTLLRNTLQRYTSTGQTTPKTSFELRRRIRSSTQSNCRLFDSRKRSEPTEGTPFSAISERGETPLKKILQPPHPLRKMASASRPVSRLERSSIALLRRNFVPPSTPENADGQSHE